VDVVEVEGGVHAGFLIHLREPEKDEVVKLEEGEVEGEAEGEGRGEVEGERSGEVGGLRYMARSCGMSAASRWGCDAARDCRAELWRAREARLEEEEGVEEEEGEGGGTVARKSLIVAQFTSSCAGSGFCIQKKYLRLGSKRWR
jgi:hypothetical protein